MIPTILYAFDNNPLVRHWVKKLHSVKMNHPQFGEVRLTLIEGNVIAEVDVERCIMPYRRGEIEAPVRITDYWCDKLDCYHTMEQVLLDHPNSKVTYLKALRLESVDAVEEMKAVGGSTFIIRPVSGTRSIDAFKFRSTEEKPFRLRQFMSIYRSLYQARQSRNYDKGFLLRGLEEIGVKVLSNNTWQDFETSMNQLSGGSKNADHFFIQSFEEFDNEYRILKVAPGQYFGYRYRDGERGWIEDLQIVKMRTLDELLGKEDADHIRTIFDDSRLPFMCSIDLGVNDTGLVVHEFSPEFMVTEYSPHDLNILATTHLNGIIDLYRSKVQPTIVELPCADYTQLQAVKERAELSLSDEDYLRLGIYLTDENVDMHVKIKTQILLKPSTVNYHTLMDNGYESLKVIPHPDGGMVEVYLKN